MLTALEHNNNTRSDPRQRKGGCRSGLQVTCVAKVMPRRSGYPHFSPSVHARRSWCFRWLRTALNSVLARLEMMSVLDETRRQDESPQHEVWE